VSRRRPPVPLREAVAALSAKGHAVDIDAHGKHFKLFWQVDGRKRLLVVARTPSDWRASANARANLRRILREEERS
jgi:hypothetical protein